jgi:hypothetical protein
MTVGEYVAAFLLKSPIRNDRAFLLPICRPEGTETTNPNCNGWDFFVLNSFLIGKVYFKIVADGLCLIYTGIKILKNKLFI